MELIKVINAMQDIAHEGKALYHVVIYDNGRLLKPKSIYTIENGKVVIETEDYYND